VVKVPAPTDVNATSILLKAKDSIELNDLLTKAIYSHTLYTDVQLDALFDQAFIQNKNEKKWTDFRIQEICARVKS